MYSFFEVRFTIMLINNLAFRKLFWSWSNSKFVAGCFKGENGNGLEKLVINLTETSSVQSKCIDQCADKSRSRYYYPPTLTSPNWVCHAEKNYIHILCIT